MRDLRLAAIVILTMLLLGLLFFSATAQAQDPIQEEAKEIAKSLNCPLCQGLTLYDCPLLVCEQWRQLIVQKLREGQTREEIIQYFIDQYGENVLNLPRREGFNWLAWILPFLALAAGAGWVGYLVYGWARRRQAPVSAAPEDTADEYLQQVEEELKEWD